MQTLKAITVGAAGVALFVGGMFVGGSADTSRAMVACTQEDSSLVYPCRWDATVSGNGEGKSFTMYAPESDGADPVFVYDK